MSNKEKKEAIKNMVNNMLTNSLESMQKNMERVLNSGCIDIEEWDGETNPYIMPRNILAALLKEEMNQYSLVGTCFERESKKQVAIIYSFL